MAKRKPVYVLIYEFHYEGYTFNGVFSTIKKVHEYINTHPPVMSGLTSWVLHRCDVDGGDEDIWSWGEKRKPRLEDMPDEGPST